MVLVLFSIIISWHMLNKSSVMCHKHVLTCIFDHPLFCKYRFNHKLPPAFKLHSQIASNFNEDETFVDTPCVYYRLLSNRKLLIPVTRSKEIHENRKMFTAITLSYEVQVCMFLFRVLSINVHSNQYKVVDSLPCKICA